MDWGTLIAAFLEWSNGLIGAFGYVGVFVVSMLSSASIFLPLSGFLFIIAAAPFLNPLAVGVIAGAGSAIGEMTGYAIGKGSHKALKRKDVKWLNRGEKWFHEKRGFLFIVIFAATPLPDDVTGILGGMFRYDWKKFLLASFIGKSLLNLLLALSGFYGAGLIMGL
ncbi:MAG: VTT domain-containing protein [Candidatus Aenigmarchaeota archaeon]|nr:VTT domain-containing protein [Candidatus Aenigmarchaeota archaeon]